MTAVPDGCHQSLAVGWTSSLAEHHSLNLRVLPVFHPINHSLIQTLLHQFGLDDILGNCVKNLVKFEVYIIYCSSLIHRDNKKIRLVRDDLSLINQCRIFLITFLSVLCLDIFLHSQRLTWG